MTVTAGVLCSCSTDEVVGVLLLDIYIFELLDFG